MQKYPNVTQDALGNVIQGMSVTVFLKGTQTLATLFSDNGVTGIPNPVTSDALGTFFFYAANGRYDLQFTKTGLPTTQLLDVLLFDPMGSGGAALVVGDVIFGAAANTLGQDGNLFWDNAAKQLLVGSAGVNTSGVIQSKSPAAGTQSYLAWNVGTAGVRYFMSLGTEAAFTARGALVYSGAQSAIGLTETTGTSGLFVDASGNVIANLKLATQTIELQNNNNPPGTVGGIYQGANVIQVRGATGGVTINNNANNVVNFQVLDSGIIKFPALGTTAVAANATLNAVGSNDLLRSTSSMRYKTDIADLLDSDLLALDQVRLVRYRSASPADDPVRIHYGMLAEDVAAINPILTTTTKLRITSNVEIDVPDWVQYERFIPLLIEQGRRDRARVKALEAAVFKN
jgi:Chaperone of endosialidase